MDPIKRVAALDPTKKAFSLLDEFKQFAFKGNMIDLAVAVMIGAAFGKVITSLVENIIMRVVGLFLPTEQGYKHWEFDIRGHQILYGLFLSDVVNFLVVALVLFIFIVKFLGWVMRAKQK